MNLDAPPLILASASARRPELLGHLGLPFAVRPSAVAEGELGDSDPRALAQDLALAKAQSVAQQNLGAVVVAADTIVVYRRRILNKPKDAAEAVAMLRRLRGRWHQVITAVAVVDAHGQPTAEHVVTRVRMRRYSDEEIDAYVASGDPLDKSGSYAIQHPTFRPAAAYEGCLCNVVGLPLWTVAKMLRRAGVEVDPGPGLLPVQCQSCPFRSILAASDHRC